MLQRKMLWEQEDLGESLNDIKSQLKTVDLHHILILKTIVTKGIIKKTQENGVIKEKKKKVPFGEHQVGKCHRK